MRTVDLPDTKAAPSLASEEQEKWQLRRLIAAMRGTWRIPSLAAALLLILGFAGLGVLRAVLPASMTFISQFHFTFPTAEAGRYPNGVPFGINEILDPAILDVVYEQLEIEKYGIERERFYGGFSIRPFATTGLETAERFRQQLLDRRLSFAERERVEQQLRNQLEVASRGAAELSFLVRSRVALPVEVGRAIVQKVPFEWARQLIEKKGVLRTAGFSGVDNVIPLASIEQLPLPLRIVAVLQASRLLDGRIGDDLRSTPGVLTVRDAVTGKSIRDIGRDIRDLELYRLNPLRATLVGSRFDDGGITLAQVIEQRIRDIDLAVADATAQAAAVGDMLSEYVQASTGLKGMAVEKRGLGPPAASADAVPQVGESFIDRIITLTRRDRDIDQAQEALLSSRVLAQLDLNGSAIALRGEQSRWKELLADARADKADRKELDDAARARIVEAIGQAGNEANAMWAAISRIEKEFAANRTGRTAEIYASYAPRSDVISGDGIPDLTAAVAIFSAAVILLTGIWGFRALALLNRKQIAIMPRG